MSLSFSLYFTYMLMLGDCDMEVSGMLLLPYMSFIFNDRLGLSLSGEGRKGERDKRGAIDYALVVQQAMCNVPKINKQTNTVVTCSL